jgi:hypothetical protein
MWSFTFKEAEVLEDRVLRKIFEPKRNEII